MIIGLTVSKHFESITGLLVTFQGFIERVRHLNYDYTIYNALASNDNPANSYGLLY